MWDINSLIKLQDNFKMKIESIYLEPFQKYHLGFTDKIVEKKIDNKLSQKLGPFDVLIKKIAKRFANLGVSAVSEYIVGLTIMIVFRKD
jgi:hypothetical protein